MKAFIVFEILSLFAGGLLTHAALAGQSRFHLLTSKCESEAADEVETTPQSPPLNVDDPATPGCNRWEVNALFNGDISRSASNWDLPLLDINYGIGDNLQLKYEVPYVKNQADNSTLQGVGTSKFGVKYMFFEDEASKLQMALYPQVEFITPSSNSVEIGLASPGTVTTIPLLLSKKLGSTSNGDITLTSNIGYNLTTHEDAANFVSVAAGVGLPVLRKVSMMGEISTEQALKKNADDIRESVVKADLGIMTSVSKQLIVYGSYGQSLYSSDDQSHTYVLAGIRLLTSGPSVTHEEKF